MHSDSVELTISIPTALADSDVAERARALIVLDAVRCERMTWMAAPAALDVAPDRLLEMARSHGVSVVRYEAADLAQDLAALAHLDRKLPRGE